MHARQKICAFHSHSSIPTSVAMVHTAYGRSVVFTAHCEFELFRVHYRLASAACPRLSCAAWRSLWLLTDMSPHASMTLNMGSLALAVAYKARGQSEGWKIQRGVTVSLRNTDCPLCHDHVWAAAHAPFMPYHVHATTPIQQSRWPTLVLNSLRGGSRLHCIS